MGITYTLTLDHDQIRFTPEGQIAIIDAITALTGSDSPGTIWAQLVQANPEVLEYCDDYRFRKGQVTPVVAGDGWEKVETLLFEYLVDTAL